MARKFLDDTHTEIAAGALPRVELPTAEGEVAGREHDLAIARQNVLQKESVLKDAITRTPDPEIESAEIVTLDRLEVPEKDDLPPLRELVASALKKRPDVAVSQFRLQTQAMALPGTENPLLPNLILQAQTYNRGASGTAQFQPNPYFVGGYGTALKQIFQRDFPNEAASLGLSIPLRNRQPQGDYGIDQLQFRQAQVSAQRNKDQIVVDVSNQVSALRQSRAKYQAARETRELNEKVLADERKKFSYGIATFNDIKVDQRTLVTAQLAELAALSAYTHARVSLDQVLGESLEKNNISFEDGLSGRVSTESRLP